MIEIKVQMDPNSKRLGYVAQNNGRNMSKLETAFHLANVIQSLIKEGTADSKGSIIDMPSMPLVRM